MSSYSKIVVRSIRQSMGRFIAILAIIALGVGFYGGLVLTKPSFIKTGDTYIKDYKMYDFRLLSTIGFDDEDISKLSQIEGVKAATGSITADAIAYGDGLTGESGTVVRFHSVTDDVNLLKLDSGRMPEAANEIVVDGYKYDDRVLGKTLRILPDNSEDTLESFKITEFTVVGTVRSPAYIRFQRGTSDIGNGQVNFFAYAPLDSFDYEYYTEAFLYYGMDYDIYSDEYEAFAEEQSDVIETRLEEIINDRFDELIGDAIAEIDDAQADVDAELADAWAELMDAKAELEDARIEIRDAREELDDARQTLDDGRDELSSSQYELNDALIQLEDQERLLNESQQQLTDGINQANLMREDLMNKLIEATYTKTDLEAQLIRTNEAIEGLEQAAAYGIPVESPYTLEQLYGARAQLEAGLVQCNDGISQLRDGVAQIDATLEELNNNQAQIDAGRGAIEDARSQLANGQSQINTATSELEDGETEYADGLIEFQNGVRDYNDGLYEYQKGLSEYQEAAAFVSRSIGSAREMVNKIDSPSVYVLGRDTDPSYIFFESDAQIVAGVARVFPVFFFALAALVVSTTMQRMVSDERGQIGTMRALGYKKSAVIMKYVIYSGSASLIGCVGGYFGGIKLFPYIIWQVYGMMYGFSDIVFANNWLVFVLSIVVSLACSVGVTVYTASAEMRGMPAELIRPKTPPAGKRILLERIGFIWKPLKFTYKVSIRNVFRFKKRMIMMIIGIAGSAALLITGMGLKDSIGDVVDVHYDNVMKYDVSVTVDDSMSVKQINQMIDKADEQLNTQATAVILRSENITHTGEDLMRDVVLYATDDANISAVVGARCDGQDMPWPGDGEIAISSKLANSNNLAAGDSITFNYGEENKAFTMKIAYVFENYIYHYAYMNVNTYEQAFGERMKPNTILLNLDDSVDVYAYGNSLSENKDVKTWSATTDMRKGFQETMTQMDSVVILVIACAAALAFIVLFNLNNITITERTREIATLKVLGFKKGETGSYFFRESFILVFFGFLFGIPAGIGLNSFVIAQIEMDMVTFIVKIVPMSFVYALGFIILFSVIVDMVMRRKIDKIDMAESLKSIE